MHRELGCNLTRHAHALSKDPSPMPSDAYADER